MIVLNCPNDHDPMRICDTLRPIALPNQMATKLNTAAETDIAIGEIPINPAPNPLVRALRYSDAEHNGFKKTNIARLIEIGLFR